MPSQLDVVLCAVVVLTPGTHSVTWENCFLAWAGCSRTVNPCSTAVQWSRTVSRTVRPYGVPVQ